MAAEAPQTLEYVPVQQRRSRVGFYVAAVAIVIACGALGRTIADRVRPGRFASNGFIKFDSSVTGIEARSIAATIALEGNRASFRPPRAFLQPVSDSKLIKVSSSGSSPEAVTAEVCLFMDKLVTMPNSTGVSMTIAQYAQPPMLPSRDLFVEALGGVIGVGLGITVVVSFRSTRA